MTSDKRHHDPEQEVASRKPTDFTIEHILNRAGTTKTCSTSSLPKVSPSFYNYLQLPISQVPHVPIVPMPDEERCTTTRNIHSYTNDKCYQEAQELNVSFESHHSGLPFTWLHCTRYCPPKVPRKKDAPQKRQLGRHPRIPFTSHQLSVLEDKFKQSPYLSSEEVTKLSRQLELADIRVKIWFQNRRARERREKLGITANLSPTRTSPPPSPSKDVLF